jgi:hypothetical protein
MANFTRKSRSHAPARAVHWLRLIPCILLVSALGCQRAGPYSCVKVSGNVTYEDGSPIPADRIRLVFVSQAPPVDPKTPPHAGFAEADGKTGTFDFATTYAYKDGIIVGEHKIFIECYRNGQLSHDLIADEYSDSAKTPLKVQSSESPFELKVRKKGARG